MLLFICQIGFFKVRSSQLRTLPDYIFMGLKIVHLMLFDCGEFIFLSQNFIFFTPQFCVPGLHTLMPNSLSALAGSLKHLVLSNNLLEEVPSFALRQLRLVMTASPLGAALPFKYFYLIVQQQNKIKRFFCQKINMHSLQY